MYQFNINGIKCDSCIAKITSLLNHKINAKNVLVSADKTKLSFESLDTINADGLNNILSKIGDYKVSALDAPPVMAVETSEEKPSYKAIYLIFTYLTAVSFIFAAKEQSVHVFMGSFMASFFLVFSFFKMIDLKGFADGYSSYDIIARKFYYYGYIYPFLELGFGIAYLIIPYNLYLNILVFAVMFISTIGVVKVKMSKRTIYCACVGTFLKVPLGTVAIIEDVLMVIMSAWMIGSLII